MKFAPKIPKRKLREWRYELKKYRGAINLIAKKSKVNRVQVSFILNGKREISGSTIGVLKAIREVLVSVREQQKIIDKEIKASMYSKRK
ncbi:MAG TPA: hypothetical protein VFL70_11010 [Bacteroidia bacterium]|nr:hypothetical protein [Bacteroidia bacterium]